MSVDLEATYQQRVQVKVKKRLDRMYKQVVPYGIPEPEFSTKAWVPD